MDFSASTTAPEVEVGIDNHFMCIKGWAKNSLIKQVQDEQSLPVTSAATQIAMAQIVAKCAQQSGINGDRLAFPSKKKDLWIQSHFPVKSNLNDRYLQDVVDTSLAGAPIPKNTAYALPKVMQFSWTIKRKQLLRNGTLNDFILADAWVPFVAFYNRNLSTVAHTHTPGS